MKRPEEVKREFVREWLDKAFSVMTRYPRLVSMPAVPTSPPGILVRTGTPP